MWPVQKQVCRHKHAKLNKWNKRKSVLKDLFLNLFSAFILNIKKKNQTHSRYLYLISSIF